MSELEELASHLERAIAELNRVARSKLAGGRDEADVVAASRAAAASVELLVALRTDRRVDLL